MALFLIEVKLICGKLFRAESISNVTSSTDKYACIIIIIVVCILTYTNAHTSMIVIMLYVIVLYVIDNGACERF